VFKYTEGLTDFPKIILLEDIYFHYDCLFGFVNKQNKVFNK